MVKLVDTLDLGSSASRRGGSSPSTRTKKVEMLSSYSAFFFRSRIYEETMKTELNEAGTLCSRLTITLEKEDYKPTYDKELKKYSKQAQMKGFRKGKVPMSAIKKMYGKGILVEVIDKKIQETIQDQIKDLSILGSPLSAEDQEAFDFDIKDLQDYTFRFDIGLAPEIDVQGVSDQDTYEKYQVEIDDAMLDEGMMDMRKRMGTQEEIQSPIEEKDIVTLLITESPSESEEPYTTEVLIMPERMTDAYKDEYVAKESGYKVTVDIYELEKDTDEDYVKKYFLKDAPDEVGRTYTTEVKTIKRLIPAELNEDFFKSAFGDDVKDETEAKVKLKENLETYYENQSQAITKRKILESLIQNHEITFPDSFLKRWLKVSNHELSEEQIETEYADFTKNLKWTLIKEKIARDQDIKVEPASVRHHLVENFKQQFAQYGYGAAGMDLDFDSIGERLMQDQKAVQRGYEEVLADQVFDHIINTVQFDDKKVNQEEYQAIVKGLQNNNA